MELLIGIAVIIIVIVAIKLGKQDDSPSFQKIPKSDAQIMYENKLDIVKRQAKERGDDDTVNAVLNMAYDGPLPKQKPDGSYTNIYNQLWDFNLAGLNYRKNISDYVGDFAGYLKPEPTNEYDPDAVAVYHSDGHHVGYIPQNCTDDIRDLGLPFPIAVFGNIEQEYDYDQHRNYFRGTVYLEIPDPNAKRPYNPKTI